ncbi:MAG: TRAP transporter small permease [Rhodospirillales bacterium]|jgi:TRAP-type C4-dicarboxylate transport system permease small subunit|nr:TRAP transporter small permease [Rhodospirillales bacterium]
MITTYNRFAEIVSKLSRWACIISLSAMTIAILINVFFRYVLNDPLSWPPEFARFTQVAVTMLASGLAVRYGRHVGVTVLVMRLPMRMQTAVFIATNFLVLCFLAVVLFEGYKLAFFEGPSQLAPSLQVSMMWAFIAVPLGAFLMIVHVIEVSLNAVVNARVGLSPYALPGSVEKTEEPEG